MGFNNIEYKSENQNGGSHHYRGKTRSVQLRVERGAAGVRLHTNSCRGGGVPRAGRRICECKVQKRARAGRFISRRSKHGMIHARKTFPLGSAPEKFSAVDENVPRVIERERAVRVA